METEEIDICLYILRDLKDRTVQLYNLLPDDSIFRVTFSAYIETLNYVINSFVDKKVCPF